MEKIIEKEYGVHIPHNTYEVMLDYNLVVENMSKRKQKKQKRVRFERDYSMSL